MNVLSYYYNMNEMFNSLFIQFYIFPTHKIWKYYNIIYKKKYLLLQIGYG